MIPGNGVSEAYDTIVGKVCLERGWVTREQLVECLRECGSKTDAADGEPSDPRSRLSDMLVSRGLVREDQMSALREEVTKILASSDSYTVVRKGDASLGQLLVKAGQARKEHIIEALSIQQHAAAKTGPVPRLGEILLQKGYVTFAALEEALGSQKVKTPLHCPACNAAYQVIEYVPTKRYLCKKCTGPLVPPGQAAPDTPEDVVEASKDPKSLVGKYVVVSELGRGGMGAVYKAWDQGLKRYVALKVLMGTGSKEEIARFRREAQTAAALRHPNIVGIYEVTTSGDKHVIAMEFIDGRSLASERIPALKAAELLVKVALAVEYAHSRGIIHRDIKPQNVMIDREGKPFVMDFGLAKSLAGHSQLTMAGTVVGTPSYMAPEQAEGRIKEVDKQSDVYSLGAVLYECLTGRPPFKGATPVETMRRVVNDNVTPPSQLAPAVPKDLETIVLKALEKDKHGRYPSARAFADDLDKFCAGGEIRARRAPAAAQVARTLKRQWAPIVALGAVATVCVLIGVIIAILAPGREDARIRTLLEMGDKLDRGGDWAGARTQYEAARVLDPENALIHKRLGDLDTREKRAKSDLETRTRSDREREAQEKARAQPEFDNGRDLLQRARTDLVRPGADLARIDLLLQQAAEHSTRAIGFFPKYAEAYLQRGQIHYLRQNFSAALQDFGAAIDQLSTFSAAYYDRGRLYLDLATEAMGQVSLRGTGAEEEAKSFREKAKSDLSAYRKLGGGDPEQSEFADALLAYSAQNYQQAAQICDRLIGRQTTNEEVYRLKGDAMSELGHRTRDDSIRQASYQEAVAAYGDALTKRVNYPEAYLARGHVLFHMGQREAAQRDLDKATALNTGSAGWYASRASILFELGRYFEAIADFERALKNKPADIGVLNNLGLLYLKQGDPRKALELFDRAVAADPKSATSLRNRGGARHAVREEAGALQDLEAALALDPGRTEIHYQMGQVHLSLRDWPRAEEDFTRSLTAAPAAEGAYFLRAQARHAQAKFQLAIADWQKCLELGSPRRDECQRLIAETKKRLGP
jgi:tetratricopeptide (TPR) repeat protein/predicted Ser/Thr protein kinase